METQQLQTEYTDIKVSHARVEHSILSPTHAVDREKLLEDWPGPKRREDSRIT